jgi:acetate---CoA ligase (ADP-forming)
MNSDLIGSASPFLRPRAIALIGASDRSAYSRSAYATCQALGFTGQVFMVNRSGNAAHGRAAVRRCSDIGEPVDTAVVMLPADAVQDALSDAAAAGIRNAVVLSSGYIETGEQGALLQRDFLSHAQALQIRVMGPNCLGFINYVDGVAACAMRPDVPPRPGPMAIISQSGAIGSGISRFAHQQGLGVSHLVCTGNEADLDLAYFGESLLDDDRVRSIVMFIETIRNKDRFIAMADRARRLERPVIIFKIGSSELTAKVAAAHTGALVGDDRVFDEVCRKFNIIRVASIEDAAITGALVAHTGPVKRGALGVVSISGGACEIVADSANKEGVELAQFAPETVGQLREIISAFGAVHNPLDITGAVVRDPSLFERALAVVSRDPGVGMVGCVQSLPANETHQVGVNRELLVQVAKGLNSAPVPGVMVNQAITPVTEFGSRAIADSGLVHVTGGLDAFIGAVGRVFRWSKSLVTLAQTDAAVDKPSEERTQRDLPRPTSEYDTLRYLAAHGVPVVPAELVLNEEGARAAASRIEGPAAVKIASRDIAHKSDIGGVLLNLTGVDAVEAGFQTVIANARRNCPDANIDGVLVVPMRSGGIELIVGFARDPVWGPVLAVGSGGVWVEVLKDTQLRLLPANHMEIVSALEHLRAAVLLRGYRGAAAADLGHLARVIGTIAEAALALGPTLQALEINPLYVRGDKVEALDALAVWSA